MKSNYSEGALTLFFEDRVTSTNAPKLRDEAFLLLEEHKPEKVVVDCETLQYISSSGLRMLQLFGGLRCLILAAKHKQLSYETKMELVEKQRKELMPYIAEAKALFARADEFFD